MMLLLSTILAIPVFGMDLEKAQDCVMIYLKQESTQPNLTLTCDGEEVLSHKVRTVDQIENPAEFRDELFKALQMLVNLKGTKTCKSYDTPEMWWGICLTQ